MPEIDPIERFQEWYEAACASEPSNPNAMTVATIGRDGMPSARTLLMKGVDAAGFVFYTNTLSLKGEELRASPSAALCFYWKSLNRQVRIRGAVEPVSDGEADAYFATRPRDSQISAWASEQSRELSERAALEQAVRDTEAKFAGQSVPRPPYWSGYRLKPEQIEFWEERPFRLHHRETFVRDGAAWRSYLQYP